MQSGRAWIVVLSMIGCGGPAAPPPPAASQAEGGEASDATRGARVVAAEPAPAAQSGRLSVRVEATRAGHSIAVAPGDSLHSGDRFVLHVQLDRQAYIHVLQFFPDGTSAVLSSRDGAPVHVTAGTETRIPPAPDEIELDDAVGEENLYVVASERPLDQVDGSVARLVDDVHTSSQEAASAPARPAQGGSRPRVTRPAAHPQADLLAGLSRGGRVVAGSRAVEADADDRGLVVARFTFQHVR